MPRFFCYWLDVFHLCPSLSCLLWFLKQIALESMRLYQEANTSAARAKWDEEAQEECSLTVSTFFLYLLFSSF